MTSLAFIQNIGPLELLVLSGCFLVPLAAAAVVLVLALKRRSNLELRVQRLEQELAAHVPPRSSNP